VQVQENQQALKKALAVLSEKAYESIGQSIEKARQDWSTRDAQEDGTISVSRGSQGVSDGKVSDPLMVADVY
jgi:hypothetical protein